MTAKVRIGIIGTSWWTDLMYVPSFRSHVQADVVAISGRNVERAAEIAGKFGNPRVYTDYRELIAAGGIDAVVVVTPDDLHHAMTMKELSASASTAGALFCGTKRTAIRSCLRDN